MRHYLGNYSHMLARVIGRSVAKTACKAIIGLMAFLFMPMAAYARTYTASPSHPFTVVVTTSYTITISLEKVGEPVGDPIFKVRSGSTYDNANSASFNEISLNKTYSGMSNNYIYQFFSDEGEHSFASCVCDSNNYFRFKIAYSNSGARFYICGNIMSLVTPYTSWEDYDTNTTVPRDWCFAGLFSHTNFASCCTSCSDLRLGATTLTEGCYYKLFYSSSASAIMTSLNTKNNRATMMFPADTLAPHCYEYMFHYNRGFMSLPKLPATHLAESCYRGMFERCTGIQTSEATGLVLPADTLAPHCYECMFAYTGKSGYFTAAPSLPATKLAPYCYCEMFYDNAFLATAPALPADTLAEGCYCRMFAVSSNNTTLSTWPRLNSTVLAPHCYEEMFINRRNSTPTNSMDTLPAIVLAPYCYRRMYYNSQLTVVPYLPATTLVDHCYEEMFYGNNKFYNIAADFTAWNDAAHATDNWMYGCATMGTFRSACKDLPISTRSVSRIPEGWCFNPQWFAFRSTGSTNTVYLTKTGSPAANLIQVSEDYGATWKTMPTTDGTKITIAANKTIFLKGTYNDIDYGTAKDMSNYYYFKFGYSRTLIVEGNIMSLLDGTGDGEYDEIDKPYCFARLFYNTPPIFDFSKCVFPATTLADNCYRNMFERAYNLTVPPVLPATTLGKECYKEMFDSCVQLTVMPELPATVVGENAYEGMFRQCSVALVKAVDTIRATTLPDNCCKLMFFKCYKLENAPYLAATSVGKSACENMFESCTSLVTVPDTLRPMTLGKNCYQYMFKNCTALTSAPAMPATTLDTACYTYMFNGCTQLKHAPAVLPALTLKYQCYAYMFYNCSNMITPPYLPAPVLATECYKYMFASTQIRHLRVAFTDWEPEGVTNATQNWFNGFDNASKGLGVFFCPAELPQSWSVNRIPGSTTYPWKVNPKEITIINTGDDYLTISGTTTGSPGGTIYFTTGLKNGNPGKWSDCDWKDLSGNNTLSYGQVMLLKLNSSSQSHVSRSANDYRSISINSNSSAILAGDVRYLLSNSPGSWTTDMMTDDYCFYKLFAGSTAPYIDASALQLPLTTLTDHCYASMFEGDTGLVKAPALPATALATSCYEAMFKGCINLDTAPNLPATALENYCYKEMFSGCSKLTYMNVGFTSWSGATDATLNWVYDVNGTGYFDADGSLAIIKGASNVPVNFMPQAELNLYENSDNSSAINAYDGLTAELLHLNRALSPTSLNTLCLPFDMSGSELKTCFGQSVQLYQLSGSEYDEGTLTLTFSPVDEISAGKPYLIKPEYAVTLIDFADKEIDKTLTNTETTYADMVGVYSPYAMTGGDKNTVFLGSGNTLYRPSSSGSMKGMRAYFSLKGAARAAKASRVRFGNRVPTDISPLYKEQNEGLTSGATLKLLRDGQLYILHSGRLYDTTGRIVE